MQQGTIRRLDRLGGKMLCAALTLHRRLWDLVGRSNSTPTRSILFLKLVEQGATVLAYSAMRRAVEMVGPSRVYFLVFAENRPIVDLMGLIPPENVIPLRHHRFSLFVWDTLLALWKIRRLGIDTTVDMEFFARASAILAYLSGATTRVGLHRFTDEGPYRGDLMTHRIQHNPHLHVATSYRLLVESIALSPEDVPLPKLDVRAWEPERPRFTPRPEEQTRVRRLLEELCPESLQSPIVLLNPNASDLMPLRKWPTERFVALGRSLLEAQKEITLVITGAPAEAAVAESLVRELDSTRAISVAGKTSLRDLFVLYTLADVLVTNDSGPAHFSSMTDIHSIVLFGPETPKLFGALSPLTQPVSAGLACSPCVNALNHRDSACRNNRCMQEISVEEVFSRIQAILWNRHGHKPSPEISYRPWKEMPQPSPETPEDFPFELPPVPPSRRAPGAEPRDWEN